MYIDFELLDKFLDENKAYHLDEHVLSFIRRFDTDMDGKLSYKEYINAFMQSTSPVKISPAKPKVYEHEYDAAEKEILSKSLYSSPVRSDYKFQVGISPSKSTDIKLKEAFKEQIELEKDLEFYKEKLAIKSDFNLFDAFKILDLAGMGWISKYGLQSALKEIGVYATSDEIFLLFKRYDTDSDGKIRLSDIYDAFEPKNREYSIILRSRNPMKTGYKNIDNKFTTETMVSFKLTLEQMIKCETSSERLRQRLQYNPSFDLYDAFKACDVNNQGFITKSGIKEFLLSNGVYKSDQDIDILIAKYDADKDGKVSLSEFREEIKPKSPSKL